MERTEDRQEILINRTMMNCVHDLNHYLWFFHLDLRAASAEKPLGQGTAKSQCSEKCTFTCRNSGYFYLCHISELCAGFPSAGEAGETLLAEVRSHTGPCSEYLFNRTRVRRGSTGHADQVSSTEVAEAVITSLTTCLTALLACSDYRSIPVLHPSLWPLWSALEN